MSRLLIYIGFFFSSLTFSMTTLVTEPSAFTSKVIVSVLRAYPSGAISSVKVYLPGFSPFIICTSLVEVQLSLIAPLASFTVSFAPGNSLPVVASTLLI